MNKVSDERLAELCQVMKHANQVNCSLRARSEDEQRSNDYWIAYNGDTITALQELAERRRIDLVLTAMLNDPQYDISIMRGRRFEVILYDTAGEREHEVYGDTLHAALAALAGRGEE